MTNAPLAALFDMDGVIVPNAPYHLKAWYEFASRHGLVLTTDDYMDHMNGHVAKDSLEFLFKRALTPDEVHQYTEEKEAVYRDLYRSQQAQTLGLAPFLEDLKTHGVRLSVGTSASISNVDFTLDGVAVRTYFDDIVDASMVQHGKPDPEIYLKAADRAGVPPSRCVVFEDAFAGIEAGLRAGMKVVALATTHPREELVSTGASLIITDFTEIHYGDIEKLLTNGSV